ncbi:MAG: NAD(P)-dependent oxidoreductase [Pseudomonadota bacterium]
MGDQPSRRTLGFVGLGQMGQPMVRRLLAAGYEVVVGDVRPEAVAAMVREGAIDGGTPRDIADRVATVLVSLPTPDVVEAVSTGPGGLIEGSAIRTYVDLSTTGPTVAKRVAAALAERDIATLDSPVSGGVGGAIKGTLAVMAAGPDALFEAERDVLAVIGKVFHVAAEPGLGQVMKLANNLLSATALAATSEVMVLGTKAGLDPRVMVDVINAGSGQNTATSDKFPRQIIPGTFAAGFATGLICKDIRLCLELAAAEGVPMWVGNNVAHLWQQALSQNGPGSDFTTVVQVVERAVGVEVRAPAGGGEG